MSWLDGITDSVEMNLSKPGDGEIQGSLVCYSPAGASRQSRSGPENPAGLRKETKAREIYNKDGVKRFRHVSTKGRSLTPTLFSISYLYRRA